MIRRFILTLLTAFLWVGGPLCAQTIQGERGEHTQVYYDGQRPLLVLHRDSLGRTLSLKSYAYDGASARPTEITHYRTDAQWTRVSYRYEGDTLTAVTVYTPGRETIRHLDTLSAVGVRAQYRTRVRIPDPALEWRLAREGSRLCAADSLLVPDPLDGDVFLFSADGRFLSRVRSAYPDAALLLWRATGQEPLRAQFADPDEDPRAIGPGIRASVIGEADVAAAMQTCGAGDTSHHGWFRGCIYLARNSGYGGVLDFAVREEYGVSPDVFYLTLTVPEGSLAQNHFNFGNYLWGASARETGVPLWLARLGAHINNFFLSPDSRGTWDSPDDQLSISAGYHWR